MHSIFTISLFLSVHEAMKYASFRYDTVEVENELNIGVKGVTLTFVNRNTSEKQKGFLPKYYVCGISIRPPSSPPSLALKQRDV